jgi:hypothetical protein
MLEEFIKKISDPSGSEIADRAILIDQKFVSVVQKIVGGNPDQIQFDPLKAKESFENINIVLEDGSKDYKAKLDNIFGIEEESNDSGLKIFASIIADVIKSDEIGEEEKLGIIDLLKKNFVFLGEDDYPKKDREEISRLILEAVGNTMSSYEEGLKVFEVIYSGFRRNFLKLIQEAQDEIEEEENKKRLSNQQSSEDEKKLILEERQKIRDRNRDAWNSAIELSPNSAKASTALTLSLVTPSPLGIIIALGFLAYTWDMGHEDGEKKPDIYNSTNVQQYADAWKEFMPNSDSRILTEQERQNAQFNPTDIGKAASRFIDAVKPDFAQDGDILKNHGLALASVKSTPLSVDNLSQS